MRCFIFYWSISELFSCSKKTTSNQLKKELRIRKTQEDFSLPMFSFILFICLFLLLFQILRTHFFKLLLFIRFGRRLFFMKLCHSCLTFVIQLIFSHFVHLLFLSLKRIYSTNIIYLILRK